MNCFGFTTIVSFAKLTHGYLTDINQTEAKFNELKNQSQERIETAKKDLENKAKKEVENKVKEEGQKAIDDLKKKFGFVISNWLSLKSKKLRLFNEL
jgi:histidinol dehydrogenase